MFEYDFQFICSNQVDTESVAEGFYNEFEGVIAFRDGQVHVTVNESTSAPVSDAILVIERLRVVDIEVQRVDPDLVDTTEIAARLGRTRQSVHQLAVGQRGSGFPPPVSSPGGKRIWEWADVIRWANMKLGSSLPLVLDHHQTTEVNSYILDRQGRQANLRNTHRLVVSAVSRNFRPVTSKRSSNYTIAPSTFAPSAR